VHFDLTRRTFALASALAVLAALPAAAADLTVVSKVRGPNGVSTWTQYFTADRIRTSDGQTDAILELASGRLTIIDHQKQEYYETSFEEMRAASEGLAAQMQGNPMLEKLGGGGEAKLEKGLPESRPVPRGGKLIGQNAVLVRRGRRAESRTIAGYECEPYLVSLGDSMSLEIWATDALQPPTHYVDASMVPYAADPLGQSFRKLFDKTREIEGFPLSTTISMTWMSHTMESLTEATEVREGAVPASAFEVPAGYQQRDSPLEQQ